MSNKIFKFSDIRKFKRKNIILNDLLYYIQDKFHPSNYLNRLHQLLYMNCIYFAHNNPLNVNQSLIVQTDIVYLPFDKETTYLFGEIN
jgi:hypothetical protein